MDQFKQRSVVFLLCTVLLLGLIIPRTCYGQEETPAEKWDKLVLLTDEALAFVQKNELAAARKKMEVLSTYFLTLEAKDYVSELEQLYVLSDTLIQAKNELNRLRFQKENAEKKLLQLKLMLDAVAHKKQPLWLNYYPAMLKTLDELFLALKNQKSDYFNLQANRLAEQYEFIRPAIVMSHPVSMVEKLDSQFKYLQLFRQEIWQKPKAGETFLNQVDNTLKVAFFQIKEQNSQSFLFLLVGIGSIIIVALCYVGWRKYRGEKEVKKSRLEK